MIKMKTVMVLLATAATFCAIGCSDESGVEVTDVEISLEQAPKNESTLSADRVYGESEIVNEVEEEAVPRGKTTSDKERGDVLNTLMQEDLVQWDAGELSQEVESSSFVYGDAIELASEVAPIADDSFAFFEKRKNGRTVFRNRSGETVKFDQSHGFWKRFGKKREFQNIPNELSNEDAKRMVESIYEKIGLPKNEKDRVISVGIGTATDKEDEEDIAVAIGRHVRIHRAINGARVFGSRISANYALDGSIINFEVNWPDFVIPSDCEIASREEFIAQLAEESSSSFYNVDLSMGMKSRPIYFYDENKRVHIPAIQIVFETNGENVGNTEQILSLCKGSTTETL